MVLDASQFAPVISAVKRIQTSSIVAPLLAADVITGVIGLLGAFVLPYPILYGVWVLFGLCVLSSLGSYAFWSWKEPNRLQTERYQLEHQRLLLVGDERDPNSPKLIESTPSANTVVGTP